MSEERTENLVKQVVKVENGVATVISVDPHESVVPAAWLPKKKAQATVAPSLAPGALSNPDEVPEAVSAAQSLELRPKTGALDPATLDARESARLAALSRDRDIVRDALALYEHIYALQKQGASLEIGPLSDDIAALVVNLNTRNSNNAPV